MEKRVAVLSSLLSETVSLLQDGYLNRGLCRILWDYRSQLESDYRLIRGGCFVPGGIECVHRMRLATNEICFLVRQARCSGNELLVARRDTLLGVARELDQNLREAVQGIVPLRRVTAEVVAIAS